MKIQVTFVTKKTQERVTFEKYIDDESKTSFVYFDDRNGIEYVYAIGTNKMYKSKGNVICGEEVELKSLTVKYIFD